MRNHWLHRFGWNRRSGRLAGGLEEEHDGEKVWELNSDADLEAQPGKDKEEKPEKKKEKGNLENE